MKSILAFIAIVLLFGCSETEKSDWKSTENEIVAEIFRNEQTAMLHEYKMASAEVPQRNKEWYERAKSLHEHSEMLVNYLDTATDTQKIADSISAYRKYIFEDSIHFYDKGKRKNEGLHNYLLTAWDGNFKTLEQNSSLAKLNVLNSTRVVLHHMYNQIDGDGCSFKFEKLFAALDPHEKRIRMGEQFQAKIFFAAADTTRPNTFLIRNKFHESQPENILLYTEKASAKVDTVRIIGYDYRKSPYSEDTLKTPFIIEYEVQK